jgi:DNA (cytosine-5)-methyltransferase 1
MSPRKEHVELNALWRHYLRFVKQLRPLGFVVENVPEFLKSVEFQLFVKSVRKLGYKLDQGVLNAADFGVPQKRRRGFIIGALGVEPALPRPTGESASVRDSIGDLPLVPDGQNLHIGRNPTPTSIERYKCIPPGGSRFDLMRKRPDLTPRCWLEKPTGSTDVFGRLEWDKPALTIRTEFFKPEKGRYLHPVAHRPITHREAARLQTFSDGFHFVGSKTEIARQIGNAVPPKLAEAVALALLAVLPRAEDHRLERALEKLGALAQSTRDRNTAEIRLTKGDGDND